MKVIDLFPPCNKEKCVDKTPGHRHILEKQQEFLDSNEKFVALVGGFGSGKTLPACVMGHLLSVMIPGNRGIVVRRSLPKLHDSTEQIYLEVLNRSGIQYKTRENRDGWPGRIIYPNKSQVLFRETKDLGRFLGPEYGWFYIDEAQEEPIKTFKDLVGRLRLPRARKFLRGFISTNPPSNQHWIAQLFPKPGSYRKTITLKDGIKVTESYRMIRSSSYENPFTGPEYVASLLSNHTPSEVKRIVEGHYGFTMEGKPVYPMFDFMKHVADPQTYQMTIYRVWDFGFTCPACSWSQIYKCKFNKWHMNVLHELLDHEVEAEPFADKVFLETNHIFESHPKTLLVEGGDAAGAARSDKGPGPIITLSKPKAQGGKGLQFRYRKFPNIDPGLDLVRRLLRTKCKCGFHLLTVHRRCRELIEAFAGGYHMPMEKPGKEGKQKPVKDGYYDNIADTVRYCAELFYRPLEAGLDIPNESMGSIDLQGSEPWSWMNRIEA